MQRFLFIMFNFKTRIMKAFEVKSLGLEEVSMSEAMSIDGGFAWIPFLILVGAGLLLSCPTAAEEYYGGELEAALCQA